MSKTGFKQFLKLVEDDSVIGALPYSFQSQDQIFTMIHNNPYYQGFRSTAIQVNQNCPPIQFVHRRLLPMVAHLFHLRKFLHVTTISPRKIMCGTERAYVDPASSKEWESTAADFNCLGERNYPNIVFPVVFYSDKTSISKNQELWPIYVYYAGVDANVVSKPDYRAMYLVGMIPIPTDQTFKNLSSAAQVRITNSFAR